MKFSLLLLALGAVSLTSCTTLENRRDLYNPQKVYGPYTRMLKDGIPDPEPVGGTTTVTTTTTTTQSSGK
ncbi:MAG: hypothetical protein SFU53_07645 [Terrimicrobiaceae bacterium]|nr:hypothetical protein [Terrimicrobiaceae bacterium]